METPQVYPPYPGQQKQNGAQPAILETVTQAAPALELESPVELTEQTARKSFLEVQEQLVEKLRVLQLTLNRARLDISKRDWSLMMAETKTAKLHSRQLGELFESLWRAEKAYRHFAK